MRSDSLIFKLLEAYGTRIRHPGQWRVHGWLRRQLRATVSEDLPVTRNGIRWVLNPADFVQQDLFWLGERDHWDTFHVLSFLKPGDTFLDVGANFGYYTLRAAQHLRGNGRVVAFEPYPPNLARLRKNVSLNPELASTITVAPLALSDAAGELRMSANEGNSGGATLCADGQYAVPLGRLDDWGREERLTSVRFIKIDVEGHEVRMLRGGEEMLRQMRPSLMVEIMGSALRRAGSSGEELVSWLRALGYELLVADREQLRPLAQVPEERELVNVFCVARR